MSKKIHIGLAFMLLIIFLVGQTGFCYSEIEVDRNVSLTIEYKYDGAAVSGAMFSIYKAAEVSSDAEYTFTDEFKNYPVSLKGLDSQGWRTAAAALAGYVSRDKINPADSGVTNSSGTVSFPSGMGSLKTGLYLVIGKKCTIGSDIYSTEPFLICLPSLNADGDWEYNVTALPKASRSRHSSSGGNSGWSTNPGITPNPSGTVNPGSNADPSTTYSPNSGTTTVKVLKAWKDAGNELKRPESVKVQILCDDEVYNEVELNAQNNWRYSCDGLSNLHTWQIVEKDVQYGYTVSVDKEGVTYVLTNTFQAIDETTPGNPDNNTIEPSSGGDRDNSGNSGKPSETVTSIPNILDVPTVPGVPEVQRVSKSSGSSGGGTSVADSGKLPQTGQLWWPVPVMAGLGMVLFVLGWIRSKT